MIDGPQPGEFFVIVKFRRRTHQYKVMHERISNKEEKFNIITEQRKVVIKASKGPLKTGIKMAQRTYSYEEAEITNKSLMNKIIEAIEKHLKA